MWKLPFDWGMLNFECFEKNCADNWFGVSSVFWMQAFSFDSGKHLSRSTHSEDSGLCELSHPVHNDKKPSPHQPNSTGTKTASPKPTKEHDHTRPDSSKVTAQSFDEPEGNEDDKKPTSHQDKPIDIKPSESSPKPANHHDDTEPDTSRVNAQSFDEPEGDEEDNQPSGITQGNNYASQNSNSTPVSTSQSPPQANQESPVRQQAEKECQSPNHWDSVSIQFSTKMTIDWRDKSFLDSLPLLYPTCWSDYSNAKCYNYEHDQCCTPKLKSSRRKSESSFDPKRLQSSTSMEFC